MAHIVEANPFEYQLTYPATQIALNQLLSSELVSHDKEISRHIKKQSIAHLIGEIQNVIHDPVSWAENIRNDLGNLAYYAPAAADVGYGAFAEREIPMGTTVIYAGRFLDTINGESITPYSQICGIPMRNGEVTLYSMEAERQGNVTRFINHSSTQAQFAVLNVIRKGLPVPVYWATKPIPAGAQLLVPYNTDAVPREMNARDLAPFEHLSQPVPAIEVR